MHLCGGILRGADFAAFRAAQEPALAPYRLCDAKLADVEILDENANWKLVLGNGCECHHCAVCHPDLSKPPNQPADGAAFHDDERAAGFLQRVREIGLKLIGRRRLVGSRPLSLNEGVLSYSVDGKPLEPKPLLDANDRAVGSLRRAIELGNFVT